MIEEDFCLPDWRRQDIALVCSGKAIVTMNDAKSRCPSCDMLVSDSTRLRFGGKCRRCHKQLISFRWQWVFFALMAIMIPLTGYWIDHDIARMESQGGTQRVHILIALAYQFTGRKGVAVIFGLACLLSVVLAARAYRATRR